LALDQYCDYRYIIAMNAIAPGAHANRHPLWRFPEDSGIPEIGLKSLRSFDSGNFVEGISAPN
jgi:hypothetical protein